MVSLRNATKADLPALSRVLVEAFTGSVVPGWLFPTPEQWEKNGARYYRYLLSNTLRDGSVLTNEEATGTLLFRAPGQTPGLRTRFYTPFQVSRLFGKRLEVSRAFANVALHHLEKPHLYLMLMAVAKAHQGQGLASQMLETAIRRADASGHPSLLYVSEANLIRYYERFGFVVEKEFSFADGVPMWAMTRSHDAAAGS